MTTQERKLEIIEQILHLESDAALLEIKQLLAELAAAGPAVPPLPSRPADAVEAELQQALREAEQGQTYAHEQVVAMAKSWRGHA